MDLGLSNLRALVSGASKGLGFATAVALAREGVHLAINSRDEDSIKQAAERISSETKVDVPPPVVNSVIVPAEAF